MSTSVSTLRPVRRVVTGHDAGGKAIVVYDSNDPRATTRPGVGTVSHPLWMTESSPARMDGGADRAEQIKGVAPPAAGSIFRIVDFPSMTDEEIAKLETGFFHQTVSNETHATAAASKYRAPSHPFMHRTCSVDYAIVLSGEIDMQLDETTLHLEAGDVLVQQGTNHAWINRSGAPCRIAFVLIGAADPFA